MHVCICSWNFKPLWVKWWNLEGLFPTTRRFVTFKVKNLSLKSCYKFWFNSVYMCKHSFSSNKEIWKWILSWLFDPSRRPSIKKVFHFHGCKKIINDQTQKSVGFGTLSNIYMYTCVKIHWRSRSQKIKLYLLCTTKGIINSYYWDSNKDEHKSWILLKVLMH